LQRLWDGHFIPERLIKDHGIDTIPDGLFVFPSGRAIAIEVENSDKGPSRFIRLAERWMDAPSSTVIFVLYVASQKNISRSLERYLPRLPENPPMGVVDLDQILTVAPGCVRTRKGPIQLFAQRSY
jgi:hypothetical protein